MIHLWSFLLKTRFTKDLFLSLPEQSLLLLFLQFQNESLIINQINMKIKDLQLKRALRSVLLILLLNAAGMGKMNAQDFVWNNLRYYYNSTGVMVGGFEGVPSGSLEIPDFAFNEYAGTWYPVTEIAPYAFYDFHYDYNSFTGDLSIGNNVNKIGELAFGYCSDFTGSLTIGNSVTEIDNGAFYRCSGFTGDLIIPNSVVTIGNNAFCYCSGFTGNLIIPNSVVTIGNYAFHGCSGFTGDLVIPNSVTEIGGESFSGVAEYIDDGYV